MHLQAGHLDSCQRRKALLKGRQSLVGLIVDGNKKFMFILYCLEDLNISAIGL